MGFGSVEKFLHNGIGTTRCGTSHAWNPLIGFMAEGYQMDWDTVIPAMTYGV
jgi:hypothetical protein